MTGSVDELRQKSSSWNKAWEGRRVRGKRHTVFAFVANDLISVSAPYELGRVLLAKRDARNRHGTW